MEKQEVQVICLFFQHQDLIIQLINLEQEQQSLEQCLVVAEVVDGMIMDQDLLLVVLVVVAEV